MRSFDPAEHPWELHAKLTILHRADLSLCRRSGSTQKCSMANQECTQRVLDLGVACLITDPQLIFFLLYASVTVG